MSLLPFHLGLGMSWVSSHPLASGPCAVSLPWICWDGKNQTPALIKEKELPGHKGTLVCFRVTWPQRTCPNSHCVSPYGLLFAPFDILLCSHVGYILKVVKSYAFPLQHTTLLFLSCASQLPKLGNLCMSQIVHWPSLLKEQHMVNFIHHSYCISVRTYTSRFKGCVFFLIFYLLSWNGILEELYWVFL